MSEGFFLLGVETEGLLEKQKTHRTKIEKDALNFGLQISFDKVPGMDVPISKGMLENAKVNPTNAFRALERLSSHSSKPEKGC